MSKDLVVFTASLAVLAVVTGLVALQVADPSFVVLILLVLALGTWFIYFFIQRADRKELVKNYLLTIVLKLLGSGIFIFVLLYADKANADANGILFMSAYLLFTGLEVGFLLRKLG